jgi:hypothetical protein
LWLRVPQEFKAPGGETEVHSFEWRLDDAKFPLAAVKCSIPKTPGAQKFLLERILFIDPKSRREPGNPSKTPRQPSPPGTYLASVTDLVTVVIIAARPPGYLSAADNTSSSPEGDMSQTQWSEPGEYVEPGQPCDNGVGIGLDIDSTFLKLPTTALCPQTSRRTICADVFIEQCFIMGMKGDCRTSNPDADNNLSRAQIVIELDRAYKDQSYTFINNTCTLFMQFCIPALPAPDNMVTTQYHGDTAITVTAKLTNSFKTFTGAMPSIDMVFVLRKASDGSWGVPFGQRDAFPTLDIWEWNPATGRKLLQHRDGTIPEALMGLAPIFSQDNWGVRCFYE